MTDGYGKPIPIIIPGQGYGGSRSAIPPEVRASIIREISEGQVSRAEIARRYGVGTATVSRIAAAAGLGYSDARTAKATLARMRLLQARRLDQTEHLGYGLDQAMVLLAYRMMTRPDDARGIADAARAVRDLAAATRDLVSIDAPSLLAAAGIEEAREQLDMIGQGLEHPEQYTDPDRGVIVIPPPPDHPEEAEQPPASPEPPPGWPEESQDQDRPWTYQVGRDQHHGPDGPAE